jgi:hypothetical protein
MLSMVECVLIEKKKGISIPFLSGGLGLESAFKIVTASCCCCGDVLNDS